MITPAGYFDWAERIHGNQQKTNLGVNPVVGICAHSAEGFETYLRTNPPVPAAIGGAKSWHLSALRDGNLLQNYSIFAQCWHAGQPWPNSNLVSIEAEGMFDQPLTDAQLNTITRVIRELSGLKAWTPKREEPRRTLFEHKDFTATACPSGRYDWDLILSLLEDDVEPVKYHRDFVAFVSREGDIRDYALFSDGTLEFMKSPRHLEDYAHIYSIPVFGLSATQRPSVNQLGKDAADSLGLPE